MSPTSTLRLFPPQLWSLRQIHRLSLVSISPLRRFSLSNSLHSAANIRIHQETLTAKDDAAKIGKIEVQITNPSFLSNPRFPVKLSLSDQAFFLLTFIACTTAASFIGFVMAAVPTLYAIGRTAIAVAKLADTVREELPSTMAAVRLSGMEISDLTLELSDLSQEISDGMNKSAKAVQAAEAGVRQIGSFARQKTMSMIDERARLPVISIQPVVVGVAKKTSQAVGHASKTFMNIISRADSGSSGDQTVDI